MCLDSYNKRLWLAAVGIHSETDHRCILHELHVDTVTTCMAVFSLMLAATLQQKPVQLVFQYNCLWPIALFITTHKRWINTVQEKEDPMICPPAPPSLWQATSRVGHYWQKHTIPMSMARVIPTTALDWRSSGQDYVENTQADPHNLNNTATLLMAMKSIELLWPIGHITHERQHPYVSEQQVQLYATVHASKPNGSFDSKTNRKDQSNSSSLQWIFC